MRDLLRDDRLFIIDVNLSRNAKPGLVFASRVLSPEGIFMTSGAALPIGITAQTEQAALAASLRSLAGSKDIRQMTAREASSWNGKIIRSCLQRGASNHVRYDDPDVVRSRPTASAAPPAASLGRNSACPCGSGKKYKVCCGKWKR